MDPLPFTWPVVALEKGTVPKDLIPPSDFLEAIAGGDGTGASAPSIDPNVTAEPTTISSKLSRHSKITESE